MQRNMHSRFKWLAVWAAMLGVSVLAEDDWGTWDDLPDDLIEVNSEISESIDAMYQQLNQRSFEKNSSAVADIEHWIQSLDLEFEDNDELQQLLDSLKGENETIVSFRLEQWLNDQINSTYPSGGDGLITATQPLGGGSSNSHPGSGLGDPLAGDSNENASDGHTGDGGNGDNSGNDGNSGSDSGD